MSDEQDGGDGFRTGWSQVEHSIANLITILLATAIKVADVAEGRKRLTELMRSGFMANYGAAMRLLEVVIERLHGTIEQKTKMRDEVALYLSQTPQWLPASKTNHGRSPEEHIESPFWDWQRRHQIEAGLIFVLVPLAAMASMLTAQKNLIGTGMPVFLDSVWLTWSMAALAPLSGFAIKTMGSHFTNDVLRSVFTLVLNILAVIAIITWVWLYAVQFSGLTPGSETDGLLDDETWWDASMVTAFTMVTLFTEILVISVLAHRLVMIASYYAPNYWVENPEFVTLSHRLEVLETALEALTCEHEAKQAELAGYQGSLDTQIHVAVMAYDARRAQRDDPTL